MDVLKIADLKLNVKTKKVERADKNIHLTNKEFDLLLYLMKSAGKIVSRKEILNKIWRYSSGIDSRVADVYVGYLRKKIETKNTKKLIHSIRGLGYSIKI